MSIDKSLVQNLVLESLRNSVKQTRSRDASGLVTSSKGGVFGTLEYRIEQEKLIPSKQLPADWRAILERLEAEVLWDLITQRILTVGAGENNPGWGSFTITAYGETVLNQPQPSHYDPEGYIARVESFSSNVDPVIIEYVGEGLACMRAGTVFAAAVMFGAAAEKAVLLLIEALANARADPQKKQQLQNLLNGQSVPARYKAIQDTLESAISDKLIPANVHQGSIQRVLCMFDMIRVQRNDAVHPKIGTCNREDVLFTIQAFPNALRVAYSIIDWLRMNTNMI